MSDQNVDNENVGIRYASFTIFYKNNCNENCLNCDKEKYVCIKCKD